MAKLRTKTCCVCHRQGEVEVDDEALASYNAGALIQDAFPDMDAGLREQIISGIHPDCWDRMFNKDKKED